MKEEAYNREIQYLTIKIFRLENELVHLGNCMKLIWPELYKMKKEETPYLVEECHTRYDILADDLAVYTLLLEHLTNAHEKGEKE